MVEKWRKSQQMFAGARGSKVKEAAAAKTFAKVFMVSGFLCTIIFIGVSGRTSGKAVYRN